MRSINEVLAVTARDELQTEIEERQELIRNMVGTLYPSIVVSEIVTIKLHIDSLRTREKGDGLMACSKCGGYDQCNCDLIRMDEQIRVKELEIIAIVNKRGRLARDRSLEEDTIPAKSLSVKMLRLTKMWAKKERKLRVYKSTIDVTPVGDRVVANVLHNCREEVLDALEDVI